MAVHDNGSAHSLLPNHHLLLDPVRECQVATVEAEIRGGQGGTGEGSEGKQKRDQ